MEQSYAPLTREIAPPAVVRMNRIAVARSIQVLIVEDDADAAALTAAALAEDCQFSVEWAANLVEAMIRLARPGIDVVLLDLGMPELHGHKSYRAIEAVAGRKLPVVILTSDDSSVSKDLTMGFGAAAYLLKNRISAGQLRMTLRNAL